MRDNMILTQKTAKDSREKSLLSELKVSIHIIISIHVYENIRQHNYN